MAVLRVHFARMAEEAKLRKITARAEINEDEILAFWDIARVEMKGRKITRDQASVLAWEAYLAGKAKFTVAHRVYWDMAK